MADSGHVDSECALCFYNFDGDSFDSDFVIVKGFLRSLLSDPLVSDFDKGRYFGEYLVNSGKIRVGRGLGAVWGVRCFDFLGYRVY